MMNSYQARAYNIRHTLQMKNAVEGGNPYHAQHIEDFCNYVDAVVAAAMEDLRQELQKTIQEEILKQKKKGKFGVDVEIDEGSLQRAKKKIDDLFQNIGKRWH